MARFWVGPLGNRTENSLRIVKRKADVDATSCTSETESAGQACGSGWGYPGQADRAGPFCGGSGQAGRAGDTVCRQARNAIRPAGETRSARCSGCQACRPDSTSEAGRPHRRDTYETGRARCTTDEARGTGRCQTHCSGGSPEQTGHPGREKAGRSRRQQALCAEQTGRAE